MKTLTLAVAPTGTTPMSAAGRGWRPALLPTATYGSGLGTTAGADRTRVAPVAAAALRGTRVRAVGAVGAVGAAALPFVASSEAGVVAVAGAQQAAAAPKQADNFVHVMPKNALPRGDRAGAPPS